VAWISDDEIKKQMGGTRSRNKIERNVRQFLVRKFEMVGRHRHKHDDRIEWMLEHTVCLVIRGY